MQWETIEYYSRGTWSDLLTSEVTVEKFYIVLCFKMIVSRAYRFEHVVLLKVITFTRKCHLFQKLHSQFQERKVSWLVRATMLLPLTLGKYYLFGDFTSCGVRFGSVFYSSGSHTLVCIIASLGGACLIQTTGPDTPEILIQQT